MSELRFESYMMPAAELGPENPLPPLQRARGVNFISNPDSDIPPEDREHLGYGFDFSLLPYRMQDSYNRQRRQQAMRVAVLENEVLRATFLLEYGGRLWSLFHKPSGRELLYVNPVFQPANLAVRNAWFSGGVEWNAAVPGHSPLTCSPLFAARVEDDAGQPMLRMYEWERIRGITYQIDAYLPDASPLLLVRVAIHNPQEHVTPMYWWSNMAVPEREDVRVVVPTDHAYRFAYQGGLRRVPIPVPEGTDATYATRLASAADYFYRLPDGQRPWIAALDSDGRGLIQASTSRLIGRKLFVWGTSPGGRHWQEFLSVPGRPYIEIQAGLARTQSHCLPMPPHAEWSWLEAYGLMEADGAVVHGSDWNRAWQEVDRRLNVLLPQAGLEAEYQRTSVAAARPPQQLVQLGSGWGALEQRRRLGAQEPALCPASIVFPDASLGAEQAPWLALLEAGELPQREPHEEPGAYMVQSEWRQLLQEALWQGRGDHWLSWLHLGVMHYQARRFDEARAAWQRSLALQPSAWAWRNLAVLAKDAQRHEAAAELYLKAIGLAPSVLRLAIEGGESLLQAGRYQDVAPLLAMLPAEVRAHSRLQLLQARAALELDDLDTVAHILSQKLEFADIREGEVALSELWFRMHELRLAREEGRAVDDELRARVRLQYPPPPELDFRMKAN